MMNKPIATMLVVCILVTQASFGDIWQDIAGYEYGDEPNPCEQAEKLLQDTPIGQYGRIEQKLIAVVAAKDATQTGKAVACRFLQQVGTARCIPAVSGLLCDEVLSHYARLVLERLKCEEANKAMRDAIKKAPDKVKIGILGSLAERRDPKAVTPAARLAHSRNAALAKAAIETLGKIGGKEAARYLSSMRPPKTLVPVRMRATVACAQSLSGNDAVTLCEKVLAGGDTACRIAALRELTRADAAKASSRIARAIKGNDVKLRRGALSIVAGTKGETLTKDMLGILGGLPADRKAELIVALGGRGDKAALDSIVRYIRSDEAVIQDAAVRAASKLGDAGVVKLLLGTANSPRLMAGVTKAVATMEGDSIDAVLVESLSDKNLRKAAIQASIARGCKEAASDLLKLAEDKDPEVRKQAWAGLAALAGEDDVSPIMDALVKIKDAGDLSDAAAAVRRTFSRAENRSECFEAAARHYQGATEAIKAFILDLGAASGDSNALRLERDALQSGDKELYARALRALAKWPNESAAPDLLELAHNASEAADRIVALRGYIRLTDLKTARLSNSERMKMLRTAMNLATRPAEKKQIIGALQNVKTLDSLKMLQQYLDDSALKAEAEMSTANLIWDLRGRHRTEVRAIAERLVESKNDAVTRKARRTIAELEKSKR